jgi:pantothenate kinase
MQCLIRGLSFFVTQISDSVFTYDLKRNEPMEFEATCPLKYPFMLVNIGSGVSILKITGEGMFERVC